MQLNAIKRSSALPCAGLGILPNVLLLSFVQIVFHFGWKQGGRPLPTRTQPHQGCQQSQLFLYSLIAWSASSFAPFQTFCAVQCCVGALQNSSIAASPRGSHAAAQR